jgi:sulfur-carrier protein
MPPVKLFASLRKIAGTKEASITGASIGEIVSELVTQIPALTGYLLENGQIRPHVLITINGHLTTDMNMPVIEKDVIAVFPPIAGG